jgi:hypothetical protein
MSIRNPSNSSQVDTSQEEKEKEKNGSALTPAETMKQFGSMFETTSVLAALYLWLIFGFLSPLVNCDLQRIIAHNAVVRHLMGLLGFYFLFTILEQSNKYHFAVVFAKTIAVYALFMLATKSRWYVISTILVLLFIDQVLKSHIGYLKKTKQGEESQIARLEKARSIMLWVIIAIIVLGAVDYAIKQRRDHPTDFSWITFYLGTGKCNLSKY